MRRVYVSHVLHDSQIASWSNAPRNFERYLRFVALALVEGNNVLSWAPYHLAESRSLVPQEHDTWRRDLIQIADELWLCSPPEASDTVKLEYQVAIQAGIPVVSWDAWWDPDYWGPMWTFRDV